MERAGIISVDGHAKARRATYRDYIDPGYHGQFDEWMARVDGTPDGFVRPQMEDGQWDPQKRLTDLATQGVVAEVLFANGTAFGLVVTLVWLYLEILRLLSKLQSRD